MVPNLGASEGGPWWGLGLGGGALGCGVLAFVAEGVEALYVGMLALVAIGVGKKRSKKVKEVKRRVQLKSLYWLILVLVLLSCLNLARAKSSGGLDVSYIVRDNQMLRKWIKDMELETQRLKETINTVEEEYLRRMEEYPKSKKTTWWERWISLFGMSSSHGAQGCLTAECCIRFLIKLIEISITKIAEITRIMVWMFIQDPH